MKSRKGNRANSTVRSSIIKTFLLTAVLPILIISTFSIYLLRNQLRMRYEAQAEIEAKRVSSIIYDTSTSVYLASEPLINNRNCKLLFGADTITENEQSMYDSIASSLSTYRGNTAAVSSIKIYTDNPNVPSSEFIEGGVDFDSASFVIPEDQSIWNSWSTQTRNDIWSHSIYELTLVRRIGIASQNYRAYLVVTLDNNNLHNRLDQDTYRIICCVDQSLSYYSSDPQYLQSPMPVSEEGDSALTAVRSVKGYNTENIFYVSVDDLDAPHAIRQLTGILVALVLFSAVIPLFIILSYAGFFSKRVNILKQAMHQASIGDYRIIDHFQGDDELTEIFNDLKKTVEMIHRQEAEYYEAKIKEQELINKQQQMEYSVLANQINPHFLYNTLETIRMLSLTHGDKEAANAIKLLGKSMRYVLDNNGTSFVPLQAELNYIRNYLAIQELRFGDRVRGFIEIEPGLNPDLYRILPLLLQPIVENAISHGLEGMESGGRVTIQASLIASGNSGEKLLCLIVTDNGCGMNRDTLESLLYRIQNRDPASGRHVGLYNIHRRLKLLYGDSASLLVTSQVDKGTSVKVTFPAEEIL